MVERFDPGWLFLLAGLAVLLSAVLIPASDDLREARRLRDQALALEAHATDRLSAYSRCLDAMDAGDETLALALAISQLNRAPAGQTPLLLTGEQPAFDASLLPYLEPAPPTLPKASRPETMLRRLASGERSRLWMIGFGGLCVMIGLLPPSVTPATLRERVRREQRERKGRRCDEA